jgi:hypothetical protein
MMTNEVDACPETDRTRFAPRILVLALFGINALTLYPFRFSTHAHFTGRSPLLLQTLFKGTSNLDTFLNVLLFVPFGFGLAALVGKRVKSRIGTALISYAAGTLASYTVELLQFYIPERDTGRQDGLTWRKARSALPRLLVVLIGVVLPALLLETVLVMSSNRAFSFDNLLLAILMSIGGWLWFNLEGVARYPSAHLTPEPSTSLPAELHNA